MSALVALAKREFMGYFYAPIAYVVGTAFLAVNGFGFWVLMKALSDPQQPAEPGAVLRHFFGGTLLHWFMVFAVIALLSMRSVAEDRRSGNWEALLTTRLSVATIVIGKWLALVTFYVFLWALTLFLLVIFRQYLPPGQSFDLGPIVSAYLALIAIGASLLAVGLLISTLTDNQIVAAVATFALCMVWLMAGEVGALQGSASTTSSWLLFVDLRESLATAARGEVQLAFYGKQLVLVVAFLTLASAMASRTRARRRSFLVCAVLLCIAGSGAVVLIQRHGGSWDVSASRVNSLTASTEAMLAQIDEPVELILVRPSEEVYDDVYRELGRLLDRMQRKQSLLVRHDVDPLDDPARVQEWAFELAISPTDLSSGGAVIVQQGGRRIGVDLLAMASFERDDLGAGALSELRAEAAIRQALGEVMEQPRARLCASVGHGEISPEGDGLAANQHWQRARERLEASGIDVGFLWSLSPDALRGCDTLVIMGPSSPLASDESLALADYLDAGGDALVALRSQTIDTQAQTANAALQLVLARYGVRVLAARVVDPSQEVAGLIDWKTVEGYGEHAIASDFNRRRLTIWSAPFALQGESDSVEAVASASDAGWAERDVKSLIRDGARVHDEHDGTQLQVAMAAQSAEGSRLVVIGSAESMSSQWSERGVGGNERFLISSILWTLGRNTASASEGKTPEHLRLLMSDRDLRRAFIGCVVVLPLGFGLIGAFLAFLRRRERTR